LIEYVRSGGVVRRIFMVGAIPVGVALLIAVAAWILLGEAERARDGAVLSSETFRTFLSLNRARDDYIAGTSTFGDAARTRFDALAATASAQLARLGASAPSAERVERIRAVARDLSAQVEHMSALTLLEADRSVLSATMAQRADALVTLTDAERHRQQAQNARLVSVLTRKDAELERKQELVTALRDLREAIAAVELNRTRIGQPVFQVEFDELEADLRQLNLAESRLQAVLLANDQSRQAAELTELSNSYRDRSRSQDGLNRVIAEGFELTRATQSGHALIVWCDARIRQNRDQQRALQADVAGLIRDSVGSNEAELSAQTIALAALRLAQQAAASLARRDAAEASRTLEEGGDLAARAQSLPMPASIQEGVKAAIAGWREQLSATVTKLHEQNELIAEMDRRAGLIDANGHTLSRAFIADADRIGTSIRRLLLAGTAGALLLGTAAVVGVARSITRPLRRLQDTMLRATVDPTLTEVGLATRRDELGDIARVSNTFLAELRRREKGWRDAAERADATLTSLRQTRSDLIRSEKLASLGQLVAGVSHEISTPLGIALTTSTQVQVDSAEFERLVDENQLSRSRLLQYAARMREGAHLLTANLLRASTLLHSFKQVAADQALEERRVIDLASWIDELLKSLRALARPGRHDIVMDCPEGICLDTDPGSLAQVLTNAIKNAVDHGLRGRQAGRISITVRADASRVTIDIDDDGHGIEPGDLGRVFDPFFTTARARGGTGLGLHIVHNIVENRLRGRVEIESVVGQGTRLRLHLPRTPG